MLLATESKCPRCERIVSTRGLSSHQGSAPCIVRAFHNECNKVGFTYRYLGDTDRLDKAGVAYLRGACTYIEGDRGRRSRVTYGTMTPRWVGYIVSIIPSIKRTRDDAFLRGVTDPEWLTALEALMKLSKRSAPTVRAWIIESLTP